MAPQVQSRDERLRSIVSPAILDRLECRKTDVWGMMGRIASPLHGGLDKPFFGMEYPMSHLDAMSRRILEKGGCEVMVFGPGRGEDLPEMVAAVGKMLDDRGKGGLIGGLHVDVFALTKALGENARKVVRTDHSGTRKRPTPFELYENKSLIGKYDVIVDQYGVCAKSYHPHRIVVKMADMLAPGGVAYIEAEMNELTYGGRKSSEKPDFLVESCEEFWRQRRKGLDYRITRASRPKERSQWFVVERLR